jgi:nucleoside-diphosphate-sugar epimerase
LKIIGLRFSNIMEPHDYSRFPGFQDDARKRKWNFWGYIDARDAAQAVRLSLESKIKGAEVFIIASADTVMERDNESLLKEVFPNVSHKRNNQIDRRLGNSPRKPATGALLRLVSQSASTECLQARHDSTHMYATGNDKKCSSICQAGRPTFALAFGVLRVANPEIL